MCVEYSQSIAIISIWKDSLKPLGVFINGKNEGKQILLNPLLNEKEAAKLLNLSVKTLQRYRLYGGGPQFIKINKSVRYSVEQIEEYLKPRVKNTCQ